MVLRFAELGIRTVVDLRTVSERAAEPDNLPPSTEQVICERPLQNAPHGSS